MSNNYREDTTQHNQDTRHNTVPAEATAGHHESDGTMGQVAGTGAGAISGGVIGASVAGPIGAVVGAIAGGVVGSVAGEAAHKIGDDHDDVNLDTGSEGSLGRDTGVGAGAISGAVLGGVTGGPVGSAVGAVGGGVLGAAAGDSAKHFGEDTPSRIGEPNADYLPVTGFPNTDAQGELDPAVHADNNYGRDLTDTDPPIGSDGMGIPPKY